MFVLWVTMLACGLDPYGYDPDSEVDKGVDRGDPANYVYPKNTDDRIILYAGNGGTTITNRTVITTEWDKAGWTVEALNDWPSDLDGVRLVIMTNVGNRSQEQNFDEAQIEQIAQALSDGTRFVFAQRSDACGSNVLFTLLEEDLASPVVLSGNSLGGADTTVTLEDLQSSSQTLEGITSLEMTNPCVVSTKNDNQVLATDGSGSVVLASHRPGDAGDIVILGDMMVLSDIGQAHSGNRAFAMNLAVVVP